MNKFYNFVNKTDVADLYITGDIIGDDEKWLYEWFDMQGTAPNDFKMQLDECKGKPLNVYIDSLGGSVFAASAIYTMIKNHDSDVTVKITGTAASAASVIAMAGTKILMSPTALLMIHDPLTSVYGNITEVEQTLDAMKVVKESIINAYVLKTNHSREEISDMMTAETWMDVNEAIKLGFCDGCISEEDNKLFTDEFLQSVKNQKIAIFNSVRKAKPNFENKTEAEEVTAEKEQLKVENEEKQRIQAQKVRLYSYKNRY